MLAFVGCETTPPGTYQESPGEKPKPVQPEAIVLREGDVVKLEFLGAPSLNAIPHIGRDGTFTLKGIDKPIVAAGKTPRELEQELIKLYAGQIELTQITITVESTFSVFVTGAVLGPGKVTTDRPITALQAIMERGGPNFTTANLKAVRVTRNVNGHIEHYRLNLKAELEGESSHPFYLKPDDIVYVPERFQWF